MEEKKLTDEELNKLITRIEYESWAQNSPELSQAAYMLKYQKAEIERLKGFLQTFKTVIKEKDEQIEQRLEEVYADFMKEYKIAKQDLKESLEREVELQMQVDEIKSDISKAIENYKKEMPTAIKEAEKKIEEMQQQAVKDTAKKILEQVRFLIEERNCVGGYDLEDETIDGTIFVQVLNELKERYGVEVE